VRTAKDPPSYTCSAGILPAFFSSGGKNESLDEKISDLKQSQSRSQT
jgi:hypothetical protein